MRKRILAVISVFLLLGMAIAAAAYQRTPARTEASMACCCCTGDSCPMKANGEAAGEATACCGDKCCCKAGNADSCPMKKTGDAAKADSASGAQPDQEKKEGCCSCCKQTK